MPKPGDIITWVIAIFMLLYLAWSVACHRVEVEAVAPSSTQHVAYAPQTAHDGRQGLESVPSAVLHPESPIPAATATVAPLRWVTGSATHYGESFNGQPMACWGTYSSQDTSIVAVAYPSMDEAIPCGTRLRVRGAAGTIDVVRVDSCPGCAANQLDLSESGQLAVCGFLGRCSVEFAILP